MEVGEGCLVALEVKGGDVGFLVEDDACCGLDFSTGGGAEDAVAVFCSELVVLVPDVGGVVFVDSAVLGVVGVGVGLLGGGYADEAVEGVVFEVEVFVADEVAVWVVLCFGGVDLVEGGVGCLGLIDLGSVVKWVVLVGVVGVFDEAVSVVVLVGVGVEGFEVASWGVGAGLAEVGGVDGGGSSLGVVGAVGGGVVDVGFLDDVALGVVGVAVGVFVEGEALEVGAEVAVLDLFLGGELEVGSSTLGVVGGSEGVAVCKGFFEDVSMGVVGAMGALVCVVVDGLDGSSEFVAVVGVVDGFVC